MDRIERLRQRLRESILVLDGAMGTAIQAEDLTPKDFGGESYEGCNENLNLTRPDVISSIHNAYLEAGSDIIETNSFGGAPFVLDEFSLGSQAREINLEAAQLARKSADAYSSEQRPRFVAGALGPTTKAISVTGGVSFEDLYKDYLLQARALWEGGSDFLLLETCQDTRNVKAGLLAIDQLSEEKGLSIPHAVSGTIEPMGTMLAGQTVDALYASLAHRNLVYLGLNCATGPEFMTDHIRTLSQLSQFPVGCVPNAGLPDEEGRYLETPEMMVQILERFIEQGWINVIGGCCGTTAPHIQAFAELANKSQTRQIKSRDQSFLSGLEYLEIADEGRPYIVGERTNVIGSRKFKKLIAKGEFEKASEIARAQVKKGAHIIDVCLADPDRDEIEDMERFLEEVTKKIKVPLMIDSTDEKVLERALTYSQGKAIINSINLEEGESRFEKVIPLAKKFGAALVVGTIDDDPEQGMGVSRERKLEIAQRSYDLLTKKYGVLPEDIYWDPLVFPCASGDENYVGSAVETIEGIRLIKKTFPRTRAVLGISNVSFGLPPAGREVLNSVFLYHCVKAGLDLAIVNSQKLERYAGIADLERKLSEDLLFDRGDDPIAKFAAQFRDKKPGAKKDAVKLPLDERLANYILEGTKEGLVEDLDEKLKTTKPLDIINGPLMKGMDEVGRLFNQNQLIVAEVLQSAEAMKAAVAHLEPLMEKNASESRGKVLLATVKGDVHDIGKNLVDIILTNNGFEVVNLGIKVPPQSLIQAIEEHDPDIVGLSGLLVKSAQQMVITAADFTAAGIRVPVMVGGAALSEKFVNLKISAAYDQGTVAYASDAMKGLELAKEIVDPEKFQKLQEKIEEKKKVAEQKAQPKPESEVPKPVNEARSESITLMEKLPLAPDYDRHVLNQKTPIEQIWRYVNPMMLYGRHLGIRGGTVRLLNRISDEPGIEEKIESEDPKSHSIWKAVEEVKETYRTGDVLNPSAVYQFFGAQSKGNKIVLLGSDQKPLSTFVFPRQTKKPGLCLSDYVHPQAEKGDNVCLFAVTMGKGVRSEGERLKEAGDYLRSHIIQALALEMAEAYAEFLHSQIRRMWGFADSVEMTMLERFQGKYRGKRYSFGYPACPELSDQKKLFELIRPEEIGIELTDGFMMDPEASVSAIVFHHEQASYFSVGSAGVGNE